MLIEGLIEYALPRAKGKKIRELPRRTGIYLPGSGRRLAPV